MSLYFLRDVIFFSFLLTLRLFEFRSIFRGGKEPCYWVDLVSTNIRGLLINHGGSEQWDAVGVTVFVRLGVQTCAPRSFVNHSVSHNLIFKQGPLTFLTLS